MTLRKGKTQRPAPSDFDPFLVEGHLKKVCIDCYMVKAMDDFRLDDDSYGPVCFECRAGEPASDHEGRGREPFVGERIIEGFRMMGEDDE